MLPLTKKGAFVGNGRCSWVSMRNTKQGSARRAKNRIVASCRCSHGGRRHSVRITPGGKLFFVEHTREQIKRTILLSELAGEDMRGCCKAFDQWVSSVHGRCHEENPIWSGLGYLVVGMRQLRAALREGPPPVLVEKRSGLTRALAFFRTPAPAESEATRGALLWLRSSGVPQTLRQCSAGCIACAHGYTAVRPPGLATLFLWSPDVPGVGQLLSRGQLSTFPGPRALLRETVRVIKRFDGVMSCLGEAP